MCLKTVWIVLPGKDLIALCFKMVAGAVEIAGSTKKHAFVHFQS